MTRLCMVVDWPSVRVAFFGGSSEVGIPKMLSEGAFCPGCSSIGCESLFCFGLFSASGSATLSDVLLIEETS